MDYSGGNCHVEFSLRAADRYPAGDVRLLDRRIAGFDYVHYLPEILY